MRTAVYLIENSITGDVYVGSTQDRVTRWYNHRYALRKGQHANQRLQRAWVKYGEAAFVFRCVATPSVDQLLLVEQAYLDQYAVERRYNHHPTAGSARGYRHTVATKEKIRQKQRGHKMAPHVREALKQANTGRVRSIKERQRIATALRGRLISEETRKKLSLANKGQQPSALAKERSRQYNKTHPPSQESRDKRSLALRGKPQGPRGPLPKTQRENLSVKLRGIKRSAATRARMCEAKAHTRRAIIAHDPKTKQPVRQYDRVAAVVVDGFSRTAVMHALRTGGRSGGLCWSYVKG